MNQYTINSIKNNPLLYNYLRENSAWYKELNRGTVSLNILEEEAKKYFKQTPEDKIKKLSKNIELISAFLDVMN